MTYYFYANYHPPPQIQKLTVPQCDTGVPLWLLRVVNKIIEKGLKRKLREVLLKSEGKIIVQASAG